MKKKMAFLLLGEDRTGKTTLQKKLTDYLTDNGKYDKLPRNKVFQITHKSIPKSFKTISFMNRSYQENCEEYLSIENFFQNYFGDADIAILSSHLILSDIEEIIRNLKSKYFNVIGVFFSNSIEENPIENSEISQLEWNERVILENNIVPAVSSEQIELQLEKPSMNFLFYIIDKTQK